jgi:ribosomal protein S18 acetylase RimI-like enzyme
VTRPGSDALVHVLPGSDVRPFAPADVAELVVLQRCCWTAEAIANQTLEIPALHETHDQVLAWAADWTTLVVRLGGRLVAAARGRAEDHDWHIGRLMVAPDLAGRGVGSALLDLIERLAPDDVDRFVLFTGGKSERNQRLYERAGYVLTAAEAIPAGHIAGAVWLVKAR